jgi:hypothetical protein
MSMMVGKMSNGSCPTPAMLLGQSKASNMCLHPLVVRPHLWDRCGRCHLSTQVLDDAAGGDVPRTFEHDVEHLVVLVVTGLEVGMAVYGLQVPSGLLEPQSIVLVSLGSTFYLPSRWREGASSSRCCFRCSRYCSTSFLISRHSSVMWHVELCTG